jgi:hypothetical protein
MTIDDALERFAVADGVADAPAIEMFRAFVEDVGPGYLTADAEQAWERAMIGGVSRPFASTSPADLVPRLLPEFLNDHLAASYEGEPEGAHAIAETMGRLITWLAEEAEIDPRTAKAALGVTRRAADQLPRAMVLATLLDRQADRVDPALEFEQAGVMDGLLRIERVQPGMLWFADGIGPVPIGEAAGRVAQAGWWVDIIVAPKGGFWHVLDVGPVYPERITPAEPTDRPD